MGDQLAKGWADRRALPQTYEEYKREMTARYLGNEIGVLGAPSLNLTEREIAAEEATLP